MWEHRTLSLAEQVFDRLEREILTGKYQRGECLTEMKLVSDLGVSRTPVREALHRLEQEHLVDISPKGILVLGVTQQDLEDHKRRDDDGVVDKGADGGFPQPLSLFHCSHTGHLTLSQARTCPAGPTASPAAR